MFLIVLVNSSNPNQDETGKRCMTSLLEGKLNLRKPNATFKIWIHQMFYCACFYSLYHYYNSYSWSLKPHLRQENALQLLLCDVNAISKDSLFHSRGSFAQSLYSCGETSNSAWHSHSSPSWGHYRKFKHIQSSWCTQISVIISLSGNQMFV